MHPVTGRMALTTQAHVTMQGSTELFYWRITWTNLLDCMAGRVWALYAHMPCTAQTVGQQTKTRTVMWLEYASTIGYILEPVL